MEKQPVVFGKEDSGTASGTTPAFYVLVKQPQTTGKADQGALASNRDDAGLASSTATPMKSKVKTCLPADCTSGGTTVTLDNNSMWNEFYHRNTEMILTKQGRRMFPYCRYWITGLESSLKYILIMDISPVDNFRYKWNGHSWEPNGKAEPHVLGRVFIHPESPSTGHYWMHQPVSFYKLKLTNNTLDQEGHIILHSMHRYLPRLHLVPADKATEVIQLNGPDVHTFTFPQTEFFAVTAYQNIQITQLKIDYNPFAKGFRDDGLSSRPQRDMKQNGSSEQEGGSVTSSPSNHRHLSEADILDPEQRELELPLSGMCNTNLEKASFSPEHDFLDFMETDMHDCDSPLLKQEACESPIDSPCQSNSPVASSLNSNGGINVVVKEEPIDDYDYGPTVNVEGINVKPEEADKEREEYFNGGDSMPEKQPEKHSEMVGTEVETESHKRPQSSQLGVAKAKMLKLDSGKMPVVYLEPCAVTRNTVKISALSQSMLSPSKSDNSHLSLSVDSLPNCFENDDISSPFTTREMEEKPVEKQLSGNNVPQRCSSFRDELWENTETYSTLTITQRASSDNLKPTAYIGPTSAKEISSVGKPGALKKHVSHMSIVCNQNIALPGPRKRGRPRKIKSSEVGQPPKYTGKPVTASNYASLGPGATHLDVKPDLEDVDGMLFVSFASKEALDIHTVDRAEEKEKLSNIQTPTLAACEPSIDPVDQRIQQLEKELLEDLKSFKYKQVIHPSLQEVGLKLNFVDPTMSIDLKYLGVQLPLSYSNDCISWKTLGTDSSCPDSGLPFVSRTGKTNDFTKIKGWRGKLHSSSKNEGSSLEGSLKNRSAFCSDKLDEYLENEGKLMETSTGFSPSTSSCPVVYQLPTKSTSYVRTLDSVLKKQSIITPSSSCTFKPLSVPSVSGKKKKKIKNKKPAVSKGKGKPPHKSAVPLPTVTKQKDSLSVLKEKVTKPQPNSEAANEIDALVVSGIEEHAQGKQIPVRQAQQQQQSSRLSSLSKTQLKLMDLEDCALWDGKLRTYITEERADLSLTALLTAQASLKNKPIHKIIKRRAPPCNNDFCRLGCICSSLALENRRPTHCRKPDCMFGCTCLKRRVLLVKGGSKRKKVLEKPLHGRHRLHSGKEQEQLEKETEQEEEQEKQKLKDKKRRKKVEYTICDTEPEKPVKNFPLWVKVDGEMDPEPVYIPTPSAVEPTKPVMPPVAEVLPSDNQPASSEVKTVSSGVKLGRVYTPRPNPVIQEEDKDPVYLYFESMMTCARVRIYDRKVEEKKQQQKCSWNSEKYVEKEHVSEPQLLRMEEHKESGNKSWWFSCSAEDPSTSYVHHITPGGTMKLIEIVSDCNWEEDRDEILNTLSQHIKSKMPKSLKVGNFAIELESEGKTWDEKNTPIYSSRVKISMSSCQNKGEKAHISVSETPNNSISPCKTTEKITSLTPGMLRDQRKKGLPFYAGLSHAGKLTAYTCKSDLNPSFLIQVNGKNYPQAKLLLGQMGALHPANRLAAYITGRLRPTVLDLSTVSTVISKVASSDKLAAREPQAAEASTTETHKTPFSSSTTVASTGKTLYTYVPAKRRIAARPLESVPSQLVMSAVGALQQKIPGIKNPQPLTGPQKFNIKSTPLSAGTTTVSTTNVVESFTVSTATTDGTIPVALPAVTTTSPTGCNKVTYSSGIALANAIGKHENSTASPTATTATVTITKSTGVATPVATIAFAKPVVAASAVTVPVSTMSLSTVLTTTASMATLTTPTSSVAGIHTGFSGTQKSPLSNQKSGATSPPGLSPRAEKRMGPRLLLIPVHQGSPTLRPPQNMQLAPGKKVILQPLRNPGGVNLYRHPNGQIIQLVPLHQFQPAGLQPTLPPVVFRNPGSVVGIRLPGPSKLPETPISQSTSVSSATLTTMASSVLPGPPTLPSPPTTKELSAPSSALPTPSTMEAPLVLSTPSSALTTLPTSEAPLVLSAPSSALPTSPISEAPLLLPVPPMTKVPSVLPVSTISEAPLVLPVPPKTEVCSVLPVPCTSEVSSTLPTASTTEVPSTSPVLPTINQTLQPIKSLPTSLSSATCTTPIVPPVPVPVSQASTLTLRIFHSGVESIATNTDSSSKITFSTNGQSNLIPLQSGSFALLQFPGQKNIPSSIEKQVASLKVKNTNQKDDCSAVKVDENTSCLQEMTAMELEVAASDAKPKENKLPANQPESHSEETMYDRNDVTSKITEKDAKTVEQLLSGDAIFQPDLVSSDCSSIGEKPTCKEIEVVTEKKQHAKLPEDVPDDVSYSSKTISEGSSQTAVLAYDTLEEQKVTMQLRSSTEGHKHSGAEQMQLETEEGGMIKQSQKLGDKQKVHKNCTEMLLQNTKSSLWENHDLELLEGKSTEKSDSVAAERDQEEMKINSAKNQNSAHGNKHVDSTQEFLHKINTNFEENCNPSSHKKSTIGIQEDNQTVKDNLLHDSRTWNKTSKQSAALENTNSIGTDEYVEKLAKCTEQNTLKTSHHTKNSTPIIDITMDDAEKDERTDDSADEVISGCQSEDIVNVEELNESESSEVEENVDIETVEELSEKINIARLKATAAQALLSKQLHLVRDHSNKVVAKTPKVDTFHSLFFFFVIYLYKGLLIYVCFSLRAEINVI
ncbi:MAX gene-associated protein-like isoform X2 [Hemicordylus capensis]|uniref:MAX gene-associated protein-like isoform X2 n=1 Tax=Hemicordylus capensis TaxID=884348 RepID=UPI002302DD78|nr:MAX gene-associated protein-like isoform X2 [Hemicordylus capensis]